MSNDVEARWVVEERSLSPNYAIVDKHEMGGGYLRAWQREVADEVCSMLNNRNALQDKAELADEWFGQRAYVDPDDGYAEHMDVGVALDDDGAFCAFGCTATGKQVIERQHDETCILTRYDALNPQPHHEGAGVPR